MGNGYCQLVLYNGILSKAFHSNLWILRAPTAIEDTPHHIVHGTFETTLVSTKIENRPTKDALGYQSVQLVPVVNEQTKNKTEIDFHR